MFLFLFLFFELQAQNPTVRMPVDTIGFSVSANQTNLYTRRTLLLYQDRIHKSWRKNGITDTSEWKGVICPHDDYMYAGFHYQQVLFNVKAPILIMIGVAHKAKGFQLQDKIIFDSYTYWKAPYGNVKVSEIREEIINKLPQESYIIHNQIHKTENSLEAFLPNIQYYSRHISILPVLIPYMNYQDMENTAILLATAIKASMDARKMVLGKDYAIIISNDAVHYGDKDWSGKNLAKFGTDTNGYIKAINFENTIIKECLTGQITPAKVRKFTNYTVEENDYKQYKWTWCGRYSVPFGLLLIYYVAILNKQTVPEGVFLDYSTSIDHRTIPVEDLGMGKTAQANLHHWVGYVSIGFK